MNSKAGQRNILVLGASSPGGVGWVAAKRFAAAGAKVAVSARRPDTLAQLASEIGGLAFPCDIADEAQVLALAKSLKEQLSHVDAVVNAVGKVVSGTIESASIADLREAMEVEYFGLFLALKHLGPIIKDGGAFVTISSLASTHYVPGVLPYANAKAAANSLVKFAAVELAPRRIRVNSILPGSIDTPMMDPIRDNPAVMKMVTREVPLGRVATAGEIAAAAEWLCADECFMTGCLLPVDGGNHLRRAPFPDEMPASVFDSKSA